MIRSGACQMWRKFLYSLFDQHCPLRRIRAFIDPYLDLSDEESADPEVVRLHKRILRWGAITGLVTSVCWMGLTTLSAIRQMNPNDPEEWVVVLAIPAFGLATFFAGIFVGVSSACAITPTWFLLGPGERWIKFIGTRNMVMARVICIAAAVLSSPILLLPLVVSVCILVFG